MRLSLAVRMLVTSLTLAVLVSGFLIGVWYVIVAVVTLLALPSSIGAVIALALVGLFVYAELTQVGTVETAADARSIAADAYPDLQATVTRVAAQLDVPVPTIAIADRSTPEAMVVGYRPETIHLVLSRGTLITLEESELEAVIAHELAHVKNRDAMVMTAASTPVVLAWGVVSRAAQIGFPGDQPPQTALKECPGRFILQTFAGLFVAPQRFLWWILGTIGLCTLAVAVPIVAILSRGRELAADRTAAIATGSPAALASALVTLEDRIANTPTEDLRSVSSVSVLSILPLDRLIEAEVTPRSIRCWPVSTHPPLERRLTELRKLENEQ